MNGSRLGRLKSILLGLLICWLSLVRVAAHDAPTSFIDLRVSPKGIDASVTASNTDLAHELPSVEPDMLLQPAVIEVQRDALTAAIQSRLQIVGRGKVAACRTTQDRIASGETRFASRLPLFLVSRAVEFRRPMPSLSLRSTASDVPEYLSERPARAAADF